MIKLKKVLALALAGALCVSAFVGCGGSNGSSDNGAATAGTEQGAADDGAAEVKTEHFKIGVAHYTDNGAAVDALHTYLDGIADDLNVEFEWETMSSTDEAANLTKVQNLISAGCKGILLSIDMGTEAIMEECAEAGVYVAGYLCDFNTSINTAYDTTLGNEYFLGAVADGCVDNTIFGEKVAQAVIDGGYKNVGLIVFPPFAFPKHMDIAAKFQEKIDEYNATAADADKITYQTEPEQLMFQPLDPTYFENNKDLDAVFSVAAGAGFVYPVMVSSGLEKDVKLFCSGFDAKDDLANFGSNGNGCYQTVCCSPIEGIDYALVLLVDKLNGNTFDDMPEKTEVVDCTSYIIQTDAQMTNMQKTIYCTNNFDDAAIKGEDLKKLCKTFNPDATYANLKDTVAGLASVVND